MKRNSRVGYTLPIVLAVLVHVGALVLTMLNLSFSSSEKTSSSVVHARLVQLETATDRAQQSRESAPSASSAPEPTESSSQEDSSVQEKEEQSSDQARQAEQDARARAEQAQALAQQQQQEAQQREKAEAERRAAQAEREKAAQQASAKAQAEQKAAAEAKRKAEQEAKEKAAAEAKRKAEQEAKEKAAAEAKRKAEQEAKKKAAAEAKRKAEQKRMAQAAAEASGDLGSEISSEQQSIANARQAKEAANGFMNLVRHYVEQNWSQPPGTSPGIQATIRIRLLPTGELVDARVIDSSGNASFDRSALQAVQKAAPFTELSKLPVAQQRQFREFNLRFNPEDVH